MATPTWDGHSKHRLFFALFVLSYLSSSSCVSVDVTELRNKVSKIKVHPRGNLWATGHFMGKKSISESQMPNFPLPAERSGNSAGEAEDLRELFTHEVLKVALQAQLQDPKDALHQDTNFILKLLKNYMKKRNV